MIVGPPPPPGTRRRQERLDALPLCLGQLRAAAWLLGERRRLEHGQDHRTSGAPCAVPLLGRRLMPPPPVRPVQPEAEPLVGLGQRQQQAAYLRRRQRDQRPCGSKAPFFPPSGSDTAVALVTSR